MTDNEVIKALECCTKDGCSNCPLYVPESTGICVKRIMFGALNLINRQKAEIEKLKEELADARFLNTGAESDGIKEFAETLWGKLIRNAEVTYDLPNDFCVDVFDKNETASIIDNLVKEMVVGDNNA